MKLASDLSVLAISKPTQKFLKSDFTCFGCIFEQNCSLPESVFLQEIFEDSDDQFAEELDEFFRHMSWNDESAEEDEEDQGLIQDEDAITELDLLAFLGDDDDDTSDDTDDYDDVFDVEIPHVPHRSVRSERSPVRFPSHTSEAGSGFSLRSLSFPAPREYN